MDAFYASIEQRDRPELRGRPVIVGAHPGGRGVVSAASYEARPFGVRSAMPISRAARLCPQAAFLPVDMEKYQRVSAQIMAILDAFSPLVEILSVDEAFVDLTGTESLWGRGSAALARIKARIRAETGLTASAGLAPNKFLAKVASELGKPDGLVVVEPGQEAAFMAPLPVERIWGVGQVMARQLAKLGFRTAGQLQRVPPRVLQRHFGAYGAVLHELALGRDERSVDAGGEAKSMGAEETFATDCRDPGRLRATLREQAERVGRELRSAGRAAATVTLKVRFDDFRTITRQRTAEPTQDGLEIYRRVEGLLDRERLVRPVRLVGLSASGLGRAGWGQLPLLDRAALRRERLDAAVDRIADRFGEGTVLPASLLPQRPARP